MNSAGAPAASRWAIHNTQQIHCKGITWPSLINTESLHGWCAGTVSLEDKSWALQKRADPCLCVYVFYSLSIHLNITHYSHSALFFCLSLGVLQRTWVFLGFGADLWCSSVFFSSICSIFSPSQLCGTNKTNLRSWTPDDIYPQSEWIQMKTLRYSHCCP